MIAATPRPSPTLALPPIGFNHRYGNTPVSAKDGFAMERALFTAQTYWEVAIHIEPVQSGYVQVDNPAAVIAARHAATSMTLVVATEDRRTIVGLLALGSDMAQQQYAQAMLDRARSFGYDHITKAQVLMFFTESDEHAVLNWSPSAGYSYTVNDNDLRGTSITPGPTQTPLPPPPSP
ncbi:MAG: hypothetical protein ABR498_09590 [Candidatus Dormibacteria bacterium]